MPQNAPLPTEFDTDPRVHFDKTAGKFQYEDEDSGQEFEWNGSAWVPLIDEELWKAQQSAYAIAGVDETTPANAVLAREERRNNKKRKKEKVEGQRTNIGGSNNNQASSSSTATSTAPPPAPKRTAVWVTQLPPTATVSQMASVFSKAGVLLIGDDGEPRIKMYYDEDGKFKGEALVMYFKEGSVDLAVRLLDDTELEMGGGFGNMRVEVATYEKTNKPAGEAKKEGEEKKYTAEDKQRMTKRIKQMQSKVTWHSDDESEDEGALIAAPKTDSRFSRVVVLKGMFVLSDLEKDPGLLIDLKEDVREEAETMGAVTSVTLYDKEEDGVMTIKFKEAKAAEACVTKMNGRFFDGRRIFAGLYTGKERFKKSGKSYGEDAEKEEKERLERFAEWLVDGEGDGDEQ